MSRSVSLRRNSLRIIRIPASASLGKPDRFILTLDGLELRAFRSFPAAVHYYFLFRAAISRGMLDSGKDYK